MGKLIKLIFLIAVVGGVTLVVINIFDSSLTNKATSAVSNATGVNKSIIDSNLNKATSLTKEGVSAAKNIASEKIKDYTKH